MLRSCPLVSFATTAIRPHVEDNLSACPPGAVILHVSLRDLSPQAILGCDNVVDDIDHVARAQTSIHLSNSSARAASSAVLLRRSWRARPPPRADETKVTVFSPFGLGILDVAVGKLVLDRARSEGRGTEIRSFLPI